MSSTASPSPPPHPLLEEAARLEQSGRDDDAEEILRRLLEADPVHVEANQRLLGLLLRTGRLDEMQAHARGLVERDPRLAFAWMRLCEALLCAGQDAVAACESAVKVAEDSPQALEYLGVALRRAGRHEEAEASLRRSLELRPGSASTHVNLANVLSEMGRAQGAIEAYRTALELDPRMTVARFSLALALMEQGRRDEPERLLQQVVEEAPTFAQAHSALGMVLSQRKRWAQAEAALRRSLELDAERPETHITLATMLLEQLRTVEAGPHLDEAIRLAPTNGLFRATRVVQTLPGVPGTREEADSAAGAFAAALQDYSAWRTSCDDVTLDSVERVPFLLAYREGNHLSLLSRFADEVGPPRTFTTAEIPAPRPKVRLGIVSEHFRRHSVWWVNTKGMLTHLDRSRFEVCLYHLGAIEDEETALARSLCDRWLDTSSVTGPTQWVAAIVGDQPDILFYPEVGAVTETYLIARERLAPVQVAGWGHPITSGLSTMDLFLSGDLLEPPDAQSHYRERLVRLPGTGACTTALAVPDDPPEALLRELAGRAGPTILIPQMPFKFDPRFDGLVARIVQAVGPCTVVIPRDPPWAAAYDALAARLGAALRSRGSDPEAALKFIPWLPRGQFNVLLDAADVVLDCTSFSGYTTAWTAAHRGAPMVTLDGPFLRQRLAAGLHRKLGITDTVVDCEDDYVRVAAAVALEGRSSPAGQARRQAIRAAAPSLDDDVAVVRAFELALLQALEERRAAQSSTGSRPRRDGFVESDCVRALLEKAARLEQGGRDHDAEEILRWILQGNPLRLDANQRLLDLLLRTGRLDEMQAHARGLVERDPQLAFAWMRLCEALLSAGQDAVAACESAVKVAKDNPQALEYLGVALRRAGLPQEAEASLRRSLELRPGSASTHVNLARLLGDMGRAQGAIEAYRTALELEPRMTVARFSLALALMEQGRRDEPERLLQQVVEEAPTFADAHHALGIVQLELKHRAQAEAALRRSLELDAERPEAHVTLATMLLEQLRTVEAGPHLDEAIRLAPTNGLFRATRVVQTLPGVPGTREEADSAAGAFAAALQDYSAWRTSCDDVTLDSVERVPFLLAYREGNHLSLLSRFADEVGPPRTFTTAKVPVPRPKVRLGIVSDHFRRHSVWWVNAKGMLTHLDRSRFEVCLYHLGAIEDEETALARSLCDRWLDTSSVTGSARWAAMIARDRPDILFYPEVGAVTETYLIARERLAPVQVAGWGHPITSGLSTMDLFLSGDLLEPPDAQSHYRERLVRLPGTGACTTALAVPDDPPEALLRELAGRAGPTILIPQMPFKFDPRFDGLVARIVQAVGPCTVVIPSDPDRAVAYDALAARLGAALRSRGSDPEAVLKFIPWLPRGQFNVLLDAADVVLDSPSFSGYTTAWTAAHRGAPMVTLDGPFLRQRLAAGLHRKLGITDTVVDCEDDYVRVAAAVALEGRSSPAGQARRQAIRAAAPSLDDDVAVVRAFELALLQALEERRAAQSSTGSRPRRDGFVESDCVHVGSSISMP